MVKIQIAIAVALTILIILIIICVTCTDIFKKERYNDNTIRNQIKKIIKINNNKYIRDLALSKDGDKLFVGFENSIDIYNLDTTNYTFSNVNTILITNKFPISKMACDITNIYVTLLDNSIYKYNLEGGQQDSNTSLSNIEIITNIKINNGYIVLSCNNNIVKILDSNLKTLFTINLDDENTQDDYIRDAIINNNMLYIANKYRLSIRKISKGSKDTIINIPYHERPNCITNIGNDIYVGCDDGWIYKINNKKSKEFLLFPPQDTGYKKIKYIISAGKYLLISVLNDGEYMLYIYNSEDVTTEYLENIKNVKSNVLTKNCNFSGCGNINCCYGYGEQSSCTFPNGWYCTAPKIIDVGEYVYEGFGKNMAFNNNVLCSTNGKDNNIIILFTDFKTTNTKPDTKTKFVIDTTGEVSNEKSEVVSYAPSLPVVHPPISLKVEKPVTTKVNEIKYKTLYIINYKFENLLLEYDTLNKYWINTNNNIILYFENGIWFIKENTNDKYKYGIYLLSENIDDIFNKQNWKKTDLSESNIFISEIPYTTTTTTSLIDSTTNPNIYNQIQIGNLSIY